MEIDQILLDDVVRPPGNAQNANLLTLEQEFAVVFKTDIIYLLTHYLLMIYYLYIKIYQCISFDLLNKLNLFNWILI